MDSEAVRNLTISAMLSKMMVNADDPTRGKLRTLLDKAKDIGLD